MPTPDVPEVISRVVATMLRRRNISEDKIADFTDEIRIKPMGHLFEHWDSGPDEELREQGRAEERKNTEAERRRADSAESRADAAESRADAAESRADAEQQRADAAEAENVKLREEIARLKEMRVQS